MQVENELSNIVPKSSHARKATKQQGTANAVVKITFLENPELSKALTKPGAVFKT